MRDNFVLENMKNGIPSTGISLTFPSTHMLEMCAYAGFDWALIDCEHGSMTNESVESLVIASEAANIIPIVRPSTAVSTNLGPLLDRGVMGVQFPHISTLEEANKIIEQTKYPPKGFRGIGSSALRIAKYDIGVSRSEYMKWANSNVLICVQIEDQIGLDNIEKLSEIDDIDVIFVGPTDLSISLGYMERNKEFDKLLLDTLQNIIKLGKIAGCAGTPNWINEYRNIGVNYLYTHIPSIITTATKDILNRGNN